MPQCDSSEASSSNATNIEGYPTQLRVLREYRRQFLRPPIVTMDGVVFGCYHRVEREMLWVVVAAMCDK